MPGKRGCGSREKPASPVLFAELLLQLGIPGQQLCLWKLCHRKGMHAGIQGFREVLSSIHCNAQPGTLIQTKLKEIQRNVTCVNLK